MPLTRPLSLWERAGVRGLHGQITMFLVQGGVTVHNTSAEKPRINADKREKKFIQSTAFIRVYPRFPFFASDL